MLGPIKATLILGLLSLANAQAEDKPKEKTHLVILSGQSNMVAIRPSTVILPALEKEFGKGNVKCIKNAVGGQAIRRWVKDWKPVEGTESGKKPKQPDPSNQQKKSTSPPYGDLYEELLSKINQELGQQKPDTVTFLWMQGESDGNKRSSGVYEKSLRSLIERLRNDLNKPQIGVVIGRISDHGLARKHIAPYWKIIREAQVSIAQEDKYIEWIDTDDCNDVIKPGQTKTSHALHMTKQGYQLMSQRFAEKAIKLIKEKSVN